MKGAVEVVELDIRLPLGANIVIAYVGFVVILCGKNELAAAVNDIKVQVWVFSGEAIPPVAVGLADWPRLYAHLSDHHASEIVRCC